MARPREFDIDAALDAALDAFWDKGYEATSMADLMEATGLQKGSLYKAFGSKHELFTTALDRYFDASLDAARNVLDSSGPAADRIRRWLRMVVERCAESRQRGCLAVNVAVELSPHDEEVADRVRRHFASYEKLVAGAIAGGQKAGEFRSDRPARELAEFLLLFMRGLLTGSKGPRAKTRLQRTTDLAIAALT